MANVKNGNGYKSFTLSPIRVGLTSSSYAITLIATDGEQRQFGTVSRNGATATITVKRPWSGKTFSFQMPSKDLFSSASFRESLMRIANVPECRWDIPFRTLVGPALRSVQVADEEVPECELTDW